MQYEEVPDALKFERRLPVVALDQYRTEVTVGHQVNEPRDARLDEVDARGPAGLQEPARQPDCHAIAIPELPAHAGRELKNPRFGERAPVKIAHQGVRDCVILALG